MLAKLTSKNQITLPQEVVKEFKGITYFDAVVQEGRILLEPVRMRPVSADLAGVRQKMKKLGIAEEDVPKAVQWSRKSNR